MPKKNTQTNTKQLAGFILHNSAVFLDEVNNLPRVNLRVKPLKPLPSVSFSEAHPINQPHWKKHTLYVALNCSVLPLAEYAPILVTFKRSTSCVRCLGESGRPSPGPAGLSRCSVLKHGFLQHCERNRGKQGLENTD